MSRTPTAALLAFGLLLLVPEAHAQQQQQTDPPGNSSNLRVWDTPSNQGAEPFGGAYGSSQQERQQKGYGLGMGGSQADNCVGLFATQAECEDPPPPPPAPEQVPIDGGLALLAAAGAGYAVRKLRRRSEKGDGEPSDALP